MREIKQFIEIRDAVAQRAPALPIGPAENGELGVSGVFAVPFGGGLVARVANVDGFGVVVERDDMPLRGVDARTLDGRELFETDTLDEVADALVRALTELDELVRAGRFEEFGVNLR